MRKITKIIIHCSATPEGRDYTVADIDRWHKQRGWQGIGYHYVVYRDGSVHSGRPVEQIGAHTRGQNANSIGVCYIGGCAADGRTPKDTRTPEQRQALRDLVELLVTEYPGATIHGHYEYAAKDCPCFDVQKSSITKRRLFTLLAALILAGCASQRATFTHTIDRDSTYYRTQRLDSLYRAIFERDSTYQRDSVYLYIKGDTVTHYVEREVYRWRVRTDTVYRETVRTDTLYMERVDSVRIEKPVYIETPIKWYNKGFIWVGRLCCLAFIFWLLFLYLKIKF